MVVFKDRRGGGGHASRVGHICCGCWMIVVLGWGIEVFRARLARRRFEIIERIVTIL